MYKKSRFSVVYRVSLKCSLPLSFYIFILIGRAMAVEHDERQDTTSWIILAV